MATSCNIDHRIIVKAEIHWGGGCMDAEELLNRRQAQLDLDREMLRFQKMLNLELDLATGKYSVKAGEHDE